jgi:hypothetical protein
MQPHLLQYNTLTVPATVPIEKTVCSHLGHFGKLDMTNRFKINNHKDSD